ncbi:unnamed protein product [Adineta steineri]|uniref:EGF-like domain-containing protein n=1 Tax=Adineta steineri TaxID=433720 RepID=A0A816C7X3_9BILA|nr:unnamed protein product [Adineta steineri]CAF1617967.1 unnamed protein product [Adineta steineri]
MRFWDLLDYNLKYSFFSRLEFLVQSIHIHFLSIKSNSRFGQYLSCRVPCSFDRIKDGDESDIDCGGSRCPKCSNAMNCKEDCDCISNICKNGRCASYLSCEDNIKNQNETDIDCGGIKCPRCDNLKNCSDDCDCISGACKNNQCIENGSTTSSIQNTTSTPSTAVSANSTSPSSAMSTISASLTSISANSSSTSSIQNATSVPFTTVFTNSNLTSSAMSTISASVTSISANSSSASTFSTTFSANSTSPSSAMSITSASITSISANSSSASILATTVSVGSTSASQTSTSANSSPTSSIQKTTSIPLTPVLTNSSLASTVMSTTLVASTFTPQRSNPTSTASMTTSITVSKCIDRIKNEDETDIDCGGSRCPKCNNIMNCNDDSDCISSYCKNKKCNPIETCDDKMKNQDETDIDCGGSKCPKCQDTKICNQASDCTSNFCNNKCVPACKNNGTCVSENNCTCSSGFSGPTCEVQSVGLCTDTETISSNPILLITFGRGSAQYSRSKPTNFNFSTTYKQQFEPKTNDGMFSFINSIHNDFLGTWHTGAKDHTGDQGGYMFLVNADYQPGQFYNGTVKNLCVGLRYEFSVYLANVCNGADRIEPNVRFEVRSLTNGNQLLAQLRSGNIPVTKNLTWKKYGLSFTAPTSSVVLLMISDARGGSGNDIVIDDIGLRVCSHKGTGFCPSN